MKKNTIVGIVTLLALGILTFFLLRNTGAPSQSGNTESNSGAPIATTPTNTTPASPTASFDTNDNLDQALQDLDAVRK